MKIFLYILGALVLVSLLIQLYTVERTNPVVVYDIPTTPVVKDVLERACYDCHSNKTAWPWYSKIAPASWIVSRDVHDGREVLNYSEWNRYGDREKIEMIRSSWRVVEAGTMPPGRYLRMHPEAVLGKDDIKILHEWASRTYPSGILPESD